MRKRADPGGSFCFRISLGCLLIRRYNPSVCVERPGFRVCMSCFLAFDLSNSPDLEDCSDHNPLNQHLGGLNAGSSLVFILPLIAPSLNSL